MLTAAELFDGTPREDDPVGAVPTLDAFVSDAERSYLQAMLKRFDGRMGAAAAALGISRKTLWEKTKRYGLRATDSLSS
jgi:DNA-binding NtrC family response regulator